MNEHPEMTVSAATAARLRVVLALALVSACGAPARSEPAPRAAEPAPSAPPSVASGIALSSAPSWSLSEHRLLSVLFDDGGAPGFIVGSPSPQTYCELAASQGGPDLRCTTRDLLGQGGITRAAGAPRYLHFTTTGDPHLRRSDGSIVGPTVEWGWVFADGAYHGVLFPGTDAAEAFLVSVEGGVERSRHALVAPPNAWVVESAVAPDQMLVGWWSQSTLRATFETFRIAEEGLGGRIDRTEISGIVGPEAACWIGGAWTFVISAARFESTVWLWRPGQAPEAVIRYESESPRHRNWCSGTSVSVVLDETLLECGRGRCALAPLARPRSTTESESRFETQSLGGGRVVRGYANADGEFAIRMGRAETIEWERRTVVTTRLAAHGLWQWHALPHAEGVLLLLLETTDDVAAVVVTEAGDVRPARVEELY